MIILFIIGEIGVRYFGTYDEDGNFTFDEMPLKPYHLPVVSTQKKIDNYLLLTSTGASTLTMVYDDLLGWAPRPNSRSEDGFFSHNSAGIRSAPTEYSLTPAEGVLRIALFGDSFTYAAEVPFEDTWGYHLENKLKEAGIAAEVLNFGVPGYGMDQAYLRWKTLGYKFSPHIVIFGLQMENTIRNVNLLRPLFSKEDEIPFSKPRFVLKEGLDLVNSPTIPPEKIPLVLSNNIAAWNLIEYETFYVPEDYKETIWLKSKLIAFIREAALSQTKDYNKSRELFYNEETWDLSKEPAQLALSIIKEFKQDVEAHGSEFLIVHLPIRRDIDTLLRGEKFQYAELLKRIEDDNRIIYPERERLGQIIGLNLSSADELFTKKKAGGHYSALGNEIIADAVAEAILSLESK